MQYAGYGVWFGERHALNHCDRLPGGLQTNNRAQVQACIYTLRVTPTHTPIQLDVDSQLVTDGATLWLQGWTRRKWRTKQGTPVAGRDLWAELHSLLLERQSAAEWVKVPSHVGLHRNEKADRLADQGVCKHGVQLKGSATSGATKRKLEGQPEVSRKPVRRRWTRAGSEGTATEFIEEDSGPREQDCSGACSSHTWTQRSSGVTKAFDVQCSSLTARRPEPARWRKSRT